MDWEKMKKVVNGEDVEEPRGCRRSERMSKKREDVEEWRECRRIEKMSKNGADVEELRRC